MRRGPRFRYATRPAPHGKEKIQATCFPATPDVFPCNAPQCAIRFTSKYQPQKTRFRITTRRKFPHRRKRMTNGRFSVEYKPGREWTRKQGNEGSPIFFQKLLFPSGPLDNCPAPSKPCAPVCALPVQNWGVCSLFAAKRRKRAIRGQFRPNTVLFPSGVFISGVSFPSRPLLFPSRPPGSFYIGGSVSIGCPGFVFHWGRSVSIECPSVSIGYPGSFSTGGARACACTGAGVYVYEARGERARAASMLRTRQNWLL